MADFEVTEFSVVMGNGVLIKQLLNGTDYDVPGGIVAEDCLVMIADSRMGGMGQTSGGGSQSPMNHGVWLSPDTDGVTEIVLKRRNADPTSNCRVTISIVSVIVPTSPSRFWVRQTDAIDFGTSDAVMSGTAIPSPADGVIDETRVWVAITGQQTDSTSRQQAHTGYFTANLVSSLAQLTRGQTGWAATCSYAVVEFAEDWAAVQRLAFTSNDAGSTIWSAASPSLANTPSITSLGGSAITDISRSFLDMQYRLNLTTKQGNDDLGETVELTGTNELTVRKSVHVDATDKHHVVWIMEWDGPAGATAPVAEHISALMTSAFEPAEEGVHTRTVTAVPTLNAASLVGLSVSTVGAATGTPRGRVDFRLDTVSTVIETRSETIKEERRAYTVFRWPSGVPVAPFATGATRAGAATMGAEQAGAGALTARGGSAALGSTEGGAGSITARGGAATLGAVEGGAQ